MKLQIALIFILLLVFTQNNLLFGQTANQQKSRAYYMQAEVAFEDENYSKTLEYLDQVVELLGGQSNATIASLRIKALYGKGDYSQAKQTLDRFYEMKATPSLSKEMSGYLIKINEALEKVRLAEIAREEKARQAALKRQEKARQAELARHKAAERVKALKEAEARFGTLNEVSKEGNLEAVNKLLALGADVNQHASGGDAPLHQAVAYGHQAVVQALLNAGANVNIRGENGFMPIHYAGEPAILRILLSVGANIEARGNDAVANATPLHLAAMSGAGSRIRLFLEFGADVNAKNGWGETPLKLALGRKSYGDRYAEAIRVLRQYGGHE